MTPVVAVEIAPARPADERKLFALLRACSRALPAGACEEAGSSQQEPAALARVNWDASGSASVTVRLRDGEHDLARELSFSSGDPELQRWRSVGLIIATIVDELRVQSKTEQAATGQGGSSAAGTGDARPTATARAAPPPRPAAAQAAALPGPSVDIQQRRRRAAMVRPNSFELGGSGGSGLSGGGLRGGAYARGAHDIAGLPAFASVRIAYLTSPSSPPSLTWTELGIGGGFQLTGRYFRFESGLNVQLVRVSASARSPLTAVMDTRASWLPGVALQLSAVWPARSLLAVRLGGWGSRLAREVVVTNAGQEIGRLLPFNWGAEGGARLAF